jgi:hypothetical protein
VLLISLAKRFIQKSNLLRLNFFLNTQSEFHFHGIKFLRSLGNQNAFLINQYSVISHWGFRLPISETLFLSSLTEPFKNIKQRPFYISYNTYSYELANSANESVHVKVNVPVFYCNYIYQHLN